MKELIKVDVNDDLRMDCSFCGLPMDFFMTKDGLGSSWGCDNCGNGTKLENIKTDRG